MTIEQIVQQFISGMKNTTVLEYIAVFSGIASVYFSRKENILVYPVGLVGTIIYIYLSFKVALYGEGSVNFYYTVMSISGWMMWAKRDRLKQPVLHITKASGKEWLQHLAFGGIFYILLFGVLSWLKHGSNNSEVIPWADAFASATAFTGMWLMNKKKVESWYWWIATNIASIPLYFIKHYVFTSVYYGVLLVMAIAGLIEWRKRVKQINK